MVQNALGLIEVVGLAAALEAADAAVKAANIQLVGYEMAKGGAMIVVKMTGDVGAIKAAVAAGEVAARSVNKVVSTHVIARPHQELSGMIFSRETSGRVTSKTVKDPTGNREEASSEPDPDEKAAEEPVLTETAVVAEVMEKPLLEISSFDEPIVDESSIDVPDNPTELESPLETTTTTFSEIIQDVETLREETCNLCGDPKCPRKKGEPRSQCIHHRKL
ncbi:BMC domain-containing protein [Heliobacterium chlorum]|uniref:BMC domain-containing protein n=1 Tax=Heliobacterium chlorum TaxID=2698 RepID=A0ABR7T1W9_HELCL|nr:BMC domain-containing protein [Heliobacterium chlorum]MBC9783849.1 BMC domain-containing protein [Heliobacterium chlorum]